MAKKIKLSIIGAGDQLSLTQFTGAPNNFWKGYEFFVNDPIDKADFWFVIQGANPGDTQCDVPKGGFMYLSAETSYPLDWFVGSPVRMKFLEQFDRVLTHHFVPLSNVEYAFPFLPWMINANHGPSILAPHHRDYSWLAAAKPPTKNNRISMICSNQQWTASHKMRFRFAEQLKAHFGETLDWFGNGVNSVAEKWDGLASYPYTIVLENQAQSGVVTEKLIDAYLAFSFPLYSGAPNASEVFGSQAMVAVDAFDIGGSIEKIEQAISVPYSDRLDSILSARDVALNEFHFLNRIVDICRTTQNSGSWDPYWRQTARLRNPAAWESRFDSTWQTPRRLLGKVLSGAGRRLEGTPNHPY